MPDAPRVSIVIPVHNDADWVASALDSCLAQTLRQVEVIVVDDASTDATATIVSRYASADSRVRLIRQKVNRSAFQARRVGVEAAQAPFVLFLDGDDELLPEAAATALALAKAEKADIVAFGSQVVKPDGSTGGAFEKSMQPRHSALHGDEVTAVLFPPGKVAQGQLWRYLFARALLSEAYGSLPADLELRRANDLPIAFLSLMRARKYVSTTSVLYRYFFRRGASGHAVTSLDEYEFMAAAVDSADAIAVAVNAEAATRDPQSQSLLVEYESVRRSVIGGVLNYITTVADKALQAACIQLLRERVGPTDLIGASADFCPKALRLIASTQPQASLRGRTPHHVALRATNLGTGGAQGVVIAQARYLVAAGFEVTIATDAVPTSEFTIPAGVSVCQIEGSTLAQKIARFAALCRERQIEAVIDHYVFYNERWPYFALAAATENIPTIGWLHNFALRPILDGTTRISFLDEYLRLLSTVVVLSATDVAFWKLRGVSNVVYLPNPPSPMLEALPTRSAPRPAPNGALHIVWWGRLQQATKQVREIVEIGSELRSLNVDFRITVIGPAGPDLNESQLQELAEDRGIADRVAVLGPLHGEELVEAIQPAHVLLNTSIIEGYPLTLVESQAMGLPIVMYELPWLAFAAANDGLITVKQGDREGAAKVLAELTHDGSLYTRLSSGALAAADRALSDDFARLYTDLLLDRLDAVHSPEPTAMDVQLIALQSVQFAERLIRKQQRMGTSANARSQIAALRRARDRATRRVDYITSGPSYRIGRVITSIPRGVLAWLQSRRRPSGSAVRQG